MKKMGKIINNNKKLFIGIIIGIVVTSIIGVSAATILYNANQVSFTAEDSDFTATNVQEALNKLYDYHKYLDNMSSANCVSGVYEHKANTQLNINIGWVPSSISLRYDNGTSYIYIVYDKTFFSSVLAAYYNHSTNSVTVSDHTSFYSIGTSISTKWATTSSAYTKAYNINYAACK